MQQKRSIKIVANCGISLPQKRQRMLKLIRLICNFESLLSRLHCNPAMKENHVTLSLFAQFNLLTDWIIFFSWCTVVSCQKINTYTIEQVNNIKINIMLQPKEVSLECYELGVSWSWCCRTILGSLFFWCEYSSVSFQYFVSHNFLGWCTRP